MPEKLTPSYDYGKKDCRKIRLRVKTPIHIGTKDGKLTGLEFISHNMETHVVEDQKLAELLYEKKLVDNFVNAIADSNSPMLLSKFFETNDKKNEIPSIAKQISRFSIPGTVGGNDFRPFVRDGFNNVYIPGTSIKGVLRTALIYGLLKDKASATELAEKRVSEAIVNLKGKPPKYFSSWIQNENLSSISLTGKKSPPNRDVLRCLSVRDAYQLGNIETRVINIKFLCKDKIGKPYFKLENGHHMIVWAEAVISGEFESEISWDTALFEKFKEKAAKNDPLIKYLSSGLDAVLGASFLMSKDVAVFEKGFFPLVDTGNAPDPATELSNLYNRYEGKYIRIGYGSGMLSTTVNMLFSEKVRQAIRNKCGIPRNGDPAPKSRRILQTQADNWLPLGWMSVIEEGDTDDNDCWVVRNTTKSAIPSDCTILLKALSGSAPMTLMAINSVRERLEKLSDKAERGMVAKALKAKLGKEYKKYKHKGFLDNCISEAPEEVQS